MPWLDFTLPNANEKVGAVNVAYLFKPDMSGFYLTFRVYFYKEIEDKYGKYLLIYLKNKSRHIREFLEEFNKLRDDFLFSMDFSEDTVILKKHSAGTIVAKYYDADNVPSDENLIKDLNYFLELYGFVLDNYEDKTDLTVDEWVEVLESEELIDEKMFSILEIMYNMDNFSATTGHISKKREELGFNDEKSYNSIVISNSKKIKEYLDKKPIYNEDGTENFWTRFFYGKKVDGTFEFKMNDKLVEAFSKINRNKNSDKIVKSLVKINKKEENGDEAMDEFSEDNNYGSFYDFLLDEGYLFDKETIENYLLSLKVKPFAILTGNSGTGKTKLSQLYAKYIAEINEDSLVEDEIESSEEYVTVKAKTNFSSWSNVGWTLNKDDFKDIIPISECEGTFDITVDGIPGRGTINLLVQLYYDKYNTDLIDFFKNLYEKDPKQLVDLKISTDTIKEFCSDNYIETNGSILLKQKANASAYKDRQWFIAKEFFDYIPFAKGYTNCKILVDKYESSARIRIAPKLTFRKNSRLQEYLRENEGKIVDVEIKVDRFNFENFKPIWEQDSKEVDDNIENIYENYRIIPVGANWTENRNIVGYYNVITDKYTSTPAYELIKDASRDLKEPYFLILDEMNLSHVERYFADFLSAIESGENIPLYGADDLEIPSNLFIIGTVNVDETTYMFSPKVLDRANVLEFKTHSAKSYMNGDIDIEAPDGDLLFLENPLVGSDIRDYGISELKKFFDDVSVDGEDFWTVLSSEIDKFQSILSKSGFDFGFRVINEIVRFMVVAWEYEGSPEEFDNWVRYFDAQIKQKMLPKLHGSEKVIGETLDLLFKACLLDEDSIVLTKETAKYYTSAKKLEEMRKVLRKQRYVSFIN